VVSYNCFIVTSGQFLWSLNKALSPWDDAFRRYYCKSSHYYHCLYFSTSQSGHFQKPVRVEFTDVSVTIGKKDILRSVNGEALSGEILAVMGPSGEQ